MRYSIALFVLTLLSSGTFGQIKLTKLDANKLPTGIVYKGKIRDAVQWTDKLGQNIVITTETGVAKGKPTDDGEDAREAELFGYHFMVSNGVAKQHWRVYDFVKECPFDVDAKFLSFTVTDLNKDNVAEIWLMYKLACRSDVSPADMKVIMYQGKQKYALRGQNKVSAGEDANGNPVYDGGTFKFDEAFEKGPKEFREFAKTLWNKNILETF